MSLHSPRSLLALVLAASFLSCSENLTPPHPVAPRAATTGSTRPEVVISQIYGAGGNSGAVLNRDYVELLNTSGAVVDVGNWKIHYASAAGTSWSNTTTIPTGTSLQPGQYLLIGGASGSTGAPVPAVDVSGSINLSGTAGKLVLTRAAVTLASVKCPVDPSIVDAVSFGTTADDCGAGRTPAPSTTNAVLRNDGGCTYTGALGSDFVAAPPAPRNSASPVHVCAGTLPVGPLDHVLVAGPSNVTEGKTIKLTATPQDANNQTIATATITGWSSSDESVATVDATGSVTGVSTSALPVTITATAEDNGITRSGSLQVTVKAPGINWINLSSSATSFPAGFQTQLFATALTASGGDTVKASFDFVSTDPSIATVATVQNTGIITGVAGSGTRPGVAVTATPIAGGAPYSHTFLPVTIEVPIAADPAIYGTNDEFGDPTPVGSDPNDMLITRPGYTLSYNQSRGTPNWVSYELDSRQIVAGQDRCNCFTADPLLPPAKQIFTSDYTNGGYDRGHMAKSADRTATNLENASTFYLTNIVPQKADLNQGVWQSFENALSDSARAGRAVYVITGPLYSRSHGLTFLKNEGKVAIPDSTWKVAVIGPRTGGLPFVRGDLASWGALDGVTVLAVNMPNVSGVRNDPWSKYLTTVDRIEDATGYDILSKLADPYQAAVEAGDHAPVPAFSVTGTADEGSAVTFDGSDTKDADLGRTDLGRTEALTYSWEFGDGATGSGLTASHTYTDNGSYTARLTVADAFGWTESVTKSVSVANVAPTVTLAATTPLAILSGDAVAVSGSFSDAGSKDAPWTALLDWGNGLTVPSTWQSPGATIDGSSPFLAAGNYTVTLTVTDKDGAAGSASVSVTVDQRPVVGRANPGSIDLAETDGDIKITLTSAPLADVTTLDLATVSVGSAELPLRKVKVKADSRSAGELVLRFARKDLLDAGVLTPATSELVVAGTLAGGVQIVSHVPVIVH